MPARVIETLKKRQCDVPQEGAGSRTNAITDAFTAKGAIEWAVFCSVRDTSQILILNAASGGIVDSVDKTPDISYLESEDGKLWTIGNGITLESPETMNTPPDSASMDPVDYRATFPKPIDHDGITHWYLYKGIEVLYSAHGRWYRVASGD
ncbi:MAG: hypothetical protein ACR2NS_14665 [Gemmatimonadaceae bacterium]